MSAIMLRWDDPNDNETYHRIYRDTAPMDVNSLPPPIAEVPANQTYYIDDSITLSTTYYYRVAAIVGGTEYVSSEVTHTSTAPANYWYDDDVIEVLVPLMSDAYHELTGTASRSAMGASLSGSTKWYGGVLGPDGKIYCVLRDATDILIIDPATGTASRSAMGASLSDSSKWTGGVLGPDGKIYCVPLSATDILIIDPATGTASRSAMGASLSGSSKWTGGVLGPDGKIYCVPLSATDILIIDPATGTASRSAMGASLSDSAKWLGGVLGPDGKIYCVPWNATDILIIDKHASVPALPQLVAASPRYNKL